MTSVLATIPPPERESFLPESRRTLLWPTLLETLNLTEVLGPTFPDTIATASEETYEKFLQHRRTRLEKKGTVENGSSTFETFSSG